MRILSLSVILFNLIFSYANSTPFQWEPLAEDDKIYVVAPSYGNADTQDYLNKAKEVLSDNKFIAEAPEDLIVPQPLGYANTLNYRQEHLKQVLFAESVKVAWAIRGGRGASEVIVPLEDLTSPSKLKLILGYSDTTALHLLAAKWGWPSLHCPVLAYHKEGAHAVNKETSLQQVFDILRGTIQDVSCTLTPINETAKQYQGVIESHIRGGNASVIQRSIGTPTHLDTEGKILFLEDTGEPATKFLEIMAHFQRARLFKGIKAIILGDFNSGLTELQRSELTSAKELFLKKMTRLDIPVLESPDFGHGDFNNPLPFGTPATLSFQRLDAVTLCVKTNN